jgi:MFS transporter, YQGE family, putative transporter
MKNPGHELKVFLSYPRNMRVLLITNFVYSFISPMISTFAGAFLMRRTHNDLKAPIFYQLMQYLGIPVAFLFNGWLLKRIRVSWLYSAGMLISGASMAWMTVQPDLTGGRIMLAGLLMGMASGFYWANRDFLIVESTTDSNRNYYYGLDSFLGITVGITMPLLLGAFISWYAGAHGPGIGAYRILAGGVFLVTVLASVVIHRGEFDNPPSTRFVFFRFHPLWAKLQALAAVKGLSGGYTVMAPAMLTMVLIGKEGSLGIIQSSGALLTAVLFYVLGRTTGPKHRIAMYTIGMLLYAVATIPNAIFYNEVGALFFIIVLMLAQPMADMADNTVQILTIDTVAAIEGRSTYAYILNREFGYMVGRVSGLLLFLVIAYRISNTAALRYALLIIGFVQLLTVWIVRSLVRGCAFYAQTAPLPAEETELALNLAEQAGANPSASIA